MSRTVSPSSGKPYSLARVCRVWRASRASVYRHLSSSRPKPPRRPGPVGPMPDAALLEAIRAVLTARPFHGEGHRKVWARLRVAGVRILAPLQVPSADGPQARVRRPGSGLPQPSQARAQSERRRCDAGRADPFRNPAPSSATPPPAWPDPPASNPAARARHDIAQE
jgi:hypothetical protein